MKSAIAVLKKNNDLTSGLPEEVRPRQLQEIKAVIRYAAEHSRFYGERFAVLPKIDSWDDFHRLPFTFPDDLRRDPYDFLCVRPNDVARIVSIMTAGTTGLSKRVFFTADDLERTVDFFHRGMSFFTEAGDTVAIFMPGSTAGSVGDLLSRGLVRLGAEPIVFGVPESGAEAAEKMLECGANVTVGMPMDMYGAAVSPFGKEVRRLGRLKSVLISADCVPSVIPGIIETGLGCRVYEHYGMTETCFGGGVYCGERDGYHLRDGDMYFEIVDIKTGTPCIPGQYGEVAVTTFASKAMPLIRYRTGDIARFKPEKCRCGYEMPVMERVLCRKNDIIMLPNGSVLTAPEIENLILPDMLPENVRLSWSENERKLTVGVYAPKRFGDCPELSRIIKDSGAEIEFIETERPETDRRAMTKRVVKRI